MAHGKDVKAQYGQSPDRIFDDARTADNIIVLAVKNGTPQMWADGDERTSQELLAQFFPSAVLPRTLTEAESGR